MCTYTTISRHKGAWLPTCDRRTALDRSHASRVTAGLYVYLLTLTGR